MSAPIFGLNEYKAWLKENKTNSLAWPFNLWLAHMTACENARLFNAAPDMLKALESFVHNYRTSEDMVSAFEMAKAAIAKAKGE